jgi:hypothetical protein
MNPLAPGAHTVDAQNPWPGLASFTEETRAFFHGREKEVAELARLVQRELVTVLFGQSGLGKTSLLRAGLVPRLAAQDYCPVYLRLDYSPEAVLPVEQVKQAIGRAAEVGAWTRACATEPGESLWEFFHHRDDCWRAADGRTLIPLVIFDQFEEIFTLAQSDDRGKERARTFVRELADLVENRAPHEFEARMDREEGVAERFDFTRTDYRVLISLREDYLPHLEALKQAMPSITQNRLRLARMEGSQALQAVLGPGRGLVSEEVARQIVLFVSGASDLVGAEIETSLLSLVCRELNEARLARGQGEISADLLAGSHETILAEFYERTFRDQPGGVRDYVEDSLLTDSGYRENIAEERARKAFATLGAPPDCLDVLVSRRMLRVEERLDLRRVELTHDVLCGIVKSSRDMRREREKQKASEAQLAATRVEEARARQALRRARLIAVSCASLAFVAVGSAVFGFVAMRRARAAEKEVRAAAEAELRAEEKRDDEVALRLIRQAELEADRMAEAKADAAGIRQQAEGAQKRAQLFEDLLTSYARAAAQPETAEGKSQRQVALAECARLIERFADAKAPGELRALSDLIAKDPEQAATRVTSSPR